MIALIRGGKDEISPAGHGMSYADIYRRSLICRVDDPVQLLKVSQCILHACWLHSAQSMLCLAYAMPQSLSAGRLL